MTNSALHSDFESHAESIRSQSDNTSSVFEKRAGTTDRGKDYEHLYVTNLILKLVTDDKVEDFYLSSNDKKFGSFDDVVVTVKYFGKKETETYAIQLKQSKNKILRSRDLTTARGNFSIRQYLEDYYKNIKSAEHRIKLILLTNCNDQIDDFITIEINDEQIGVKIGSIHGEDLLSPYTDRKCFCLLTTTSKYKDFFRSFFMYTGQADVYQLEQLTLKLFGNFFHCGSSAFKDFVNFIVKWSVKDGRKEKLGKKWMQQTIGFCLVSPFIKPLSFGRTRNMSHEEQLFKTVVSKFQVTILDRNNFDKVKNIWGLASDLDLDMANRIRMKYQMGLNHIQSINDLSNDYKEANKLLWLLGQCPLVVEESQEIYQAIKLCRSLTFTVLTSDLSSKPDIFSFQNLSHLKIHRQLYEEVLSNFTYSLECQKEDDLNALLKVDQDFDVSLTIDDLVQMLEGPLNIGQQKGTLPQCHVPRSLWRIFIDSSFLKEADTSFIVLTHVPDFENFRLKFFDLQIIDSESGSEINFPKKSNTSLIYLSRSGYNQEEFDKLCCEKTRRRKCHQLRYVSGEHLEWIRSYNVQEVKRFRLDHEYVESFRESDLFSDGENNINIICANSGMGKSTLMRSLKTSSSSSMWNLIIYVRNHSLYYRQKLQVDTFLDYVCVHNCKNYSDRDKQFFKTMMNQRKVRIIWDGLDEIPKEHLDNVLTLIKELSNRGIKQWMTARNNLKSFLEDKLQTFSRKIKEFDAGEQRDYIQKRLKYSNDDLLALFKKVETNIQPFSNIDILGIPLQVYMLTELLIQDEDKYTKLLNQSFSILDLYENFVSEKFSLYYEEKMKLDLEVGNNYQKFKEEMKQRIECYKRVAFGAYFKRGIFDYFNKTTDAFLEEVKEFGDPVGFISNVINDTPEFVHASFGEYFTSLYLYDSDPYKAKDQKFVTNDDYNNIRFFLDLLLAKNSKAHLAILYKNSSFLDECNEQELSRLDKIGRSALELSCSWSYKYEIVKIYRMGFGRFNIYTKNLDDNNVKKLQYTHDFTRIDTVDMRIKKILLLMPFLIPLYSKNVDEECAALLIYYCVVFDHITIFKYMDSIPFLKRAYENFHPNYLLSVALINESYKFLQELVLKEEYRKSLRDNLNILLDSCRFRIDHIFSILSKNVININELIFFACGEGKVENVKFLVNKGVKTNICDGDGRFPIHHACNNEVGGFRIVEFLIEKKENTDVLDLEKRLPAHYASMNTKFSSKILTLLNTKNFDLLDAYYRAPIHYACDNEELGWEVAEFLVTNGVDLNHQDIDDRTPLHYACMNWKFGLEITALLLNHGANFNTLDCKRRTPLHYACKNYHRGFHIVKLLTDRSADVNLEDVQGRTAIHFVCESGKFDTARLLIEKIDRIFPNQNPTVLHDACKNYSHGFEICELLLEEGFSVNLLDKDRVSPLHNACQFGKPETVQLLLSRRASINVQDSKNRLPFHYACMNIYHSAQIVQLLIEANSRIGVMDIYNRLPIHYACKKANVYVVFLLTEKYNTQIHIPDPDGRLPIHYACCNFNNGYEIVKFLVNKGASVNVGDRKGKMPLHYACETGSIYLVRLLLEMETKLNVKDSNNRTPLDYAYEARNYNILQLLATD